jgi:hypothetical protein
LSPPRLAAHASGKSSRKKRRDYSDSGAVWNLDITPICRDTSDSQSTKEGSDSVGQSPGLCIRTAALRNPDDRRGLLAPIIVHRFAVATRYTPLFTTVRRFFDDDPVDLAARTTQRTGNEPLALHELRSSARIALLSGRTP